MHSVLLLLQPAVNHLCFATAGREVPAGGYRPVLDRNVRPVFTTYSRHDAPLTRFFHWALRRDSDYREPLPAGWPEPPSKFAALGGFGPRGADEETRRVPLRAVGETYDLPEGCRLAAVDGSNGIRSHGGVSVPQTCPRRRWAGISPGGSPRGGRALAPTPVRDGRRVPLSRRSPIGTAGEARAELVRDR